MSRRRSKASPSATGANDETAAARLVAIVDSSHDAIYSITLDGIITSWNRAAETLFGWPATAAIGQPISLIVPPEHQREDDDVLARVRDGQIVDHFETVRLSRQGSSSTCR
jgi:PAS domain S-box-containing protein